MVGCLAMQHFLTNSLNGYRRAKLIRSYCSEPFRLTGGFVLMTTRFSQPSWARQATLHLILASLSLMLISVAYCFLMAKFDGANASLTQSAIWGLSDWGIWLLLSPLLVDEVSRNSRLHLTNRFLLKLAMLATCWMPALAVAIRCLTEWWLGNGQWQSVAVLAYKRLPVYLVLWLLMLAWVLWQKLSAESRQPRTALTSEAAVNDDPLEPEHKTPTRLEPVSPPETLVVYSAKGEQLVRLSDILYLKACGNYMEVAVEGKIFLLRATMKALEQALQQSPLVRCHRSYLVNLNAVQRLEFAQSGNHNLQLSNGDQVPLSKSYRDTVRQQWQQTHQTAQWPLALNQ